MNTYCWIHGTFTIPSQIAGKVGSQVAHPGVAPLHNTKPTLDPNDPYLIRYTAEGDEVRHAWYQWVCFVLFLQALMCYVPHYLWKSWEGKVSNSFFIKNVKYCLMSTYFPFNE
jgi:hypothetical protein